LPSCHFPITVQITGTPSDDQLELLGAHIERAVFEQIAAAERELGHLLASHGTIVARPESPSAVPAVHVAARPGHRHRQRTRTRHVPGSAGASKPPAATPPPATAKAASDDRPSSPVGAAAGKPPATPAPEPVAGSVGLALEQVKLISSQTNKVRSLRPWVIFETLPWNPRDDALKKELFLKLKGAYAALHQAQGVLADAQRREAAAASVPPQPSRRRKGKGATKPPTIAQAQAVVTSAESQVGDVTRQLKQYVKSKLDTPNSNPRTAQAKAELKKAQNEKRAIESQLTAVKHHRRPDPGEVDRLTEQLAAARSRESAAAATLTRLLEDLRTEIDQADWSEQEIDQTIAVYEVDGAQATLKSQVEAYATITPEGFEGKAKRTVASSTTVPELLAKDTNIGDSAKKILAIISGFEGGFTALNTWDIADVTFGMVQWTTGSGGIGDLTRALSIIKRAAPGAFAARLTRYGLDVDPRAGLVLTRPDGTVLKGIDAAQAIKFDAKLAAVLSAAGTDPAIQAAELRAAYQIEVKGQLNRKLPVHFPATSPGAKATTVAIPVSALITSEYGVGVLVNRTVHAGPPAEKDLVHAIDQYVTSHHIQPTDDLADWGPDCEVDLLTVIKTRADKDRIAAMSKKLDHTPGSFR
jgi:hypothetical protein